MSVNRIQGLDSVEEDKEELPKVTFAEVEPLVKV